jgi:hypothetical protein
MARCDEQHERQRYDLQRRGDLHDAHERLASRRNEGFRQARARSMVALQWTNAECGLGFCGTDGG